MRGGYLTLVADLLAVPSVFTGGQSNKLFVRGGSGERCGQPYHHAGNSVQRMSAAEPYRGSGTLSDKRGSRADSLSWRSLKLLTTHPIFYRPKKKKKEKKSLQKIYNSIRFREKKRSVKKYIFDGTCSFATCVSLGRSKRKNDFNNVSDRTSGRREMWRRSPAEFKFLSIADRRASGTPCDAERDPS